MFKPKVEDPKVKEWAVVPGEPLSSVVTVGVLYKAASFSTPY